MHPANKQQTRLNELVIERRDCLGVLKDLPDKCCDIFTDPPYNVGKNYGPVSDSMPDEEYAEWISEVLKECKRVAHVLAVYVPKKWNLLYWNVLGSDFREIILPNRVLNSFFYGFVNRYNKLLTNARPQKTKQILNVWENMPMPGTGYFLESKHRKRQPYEQSNPRPCKVDQDFRPDAFVQLRVNEQEKK